MRCCCDRRRALPVLTKDNTFLCGLLGFDADVFLSGYIWLVDGVLPVSFSFSSDSHGFMTMLTKSSLTTSFCLFASESWKCSRSYYIYIFGNRKYTVNQSDISRQKYISIESKQSTQKSIIFGQQNPESVQDRIIYTFFVFHLQSNLY
jgi:hypothetical protein